MPAQFSLPPESRSLWDLEPRPSYDPLVENRTADVVVIGGGLAGLTTAALLARTGASVVVLEGGKVGSGTTGRTTAKISALQSTKYHTITQEHGAESARRYASAQLAALEWMADRVARRDVACGFERRPAATYTTVADHVATIEAEVSAASAAGLDVTTDDPPDLPFEVAAAVMLPNQAQFDPMPYLADLAAELDGTAGCAVHELSRVMKVSNNGKVTTERAEIEAERVVVTTLLPILDRGLFFARAEPKRSYCVALRATGMLPETMAISIDAPTRSLRSAPVNGKRLVVLGGGGHVVGRRSPTMAEYEALAETAGKWFPGSVIERRWSAQDYAPVDSLPMVGPLLPKHDRIFVATGFAKWGMTNATAAAMALADHIDGGDEHGSGPWRELFDPARISLHGMTSLARLNGAVAVHLTRDWLLPPPARAQVAAPVTGRRGLTPVAESHGEAEGRCAVSRVCSHLGGIVHWNDAEESWDCPLHGSRFARCGAVLEGPAVAPLSEVPIADPGGD